jgi:hypothetical protein
MAAAIVEAERRPRRESNSCYRREEALARNVD